jgi:hypothetical protein
MDGYASNEKEGNEEEGNGKMRRFQTKFSTVRPDWCLSGLGTVIQTR